MKCLGKDCGGQGNEEKRPNPMMRMYTVHEPSPSSIEMTGYLLLTLMTSNKSTEALPFLRWLNSKRNSLGGWYSTQVCFHFVIIVQKSYFFWGSLAFHSNHISFRSVYHSLYRCLIIIVFRQSSNNNV